MSNCIIKNEETGKYISFILIGRMGIAKEIKYTKDKQLALIFENTEEAEATIRFIGEVIDWELEEQLQIVKIID